MLDILIQDSSIVDGTGKAAFKADVGITRGRITILTDGVERQARRIIRAAHLYLAPGFIDPHTHSDMSIPANPRAESKIHQGVTTEVTGNCGISLAPLAGAAIEEAQAQVKNFGVDITWRSMAEYLNHLRNLGAAVNVVPLVGHNTVRGSILGFDDVQPTPEQQTEMERVVAEAMEQGARGLSTGLFYPPGFYTRTAEVIELARTAARYGGIYASHIRNESNHLLESVAEAIEIGEQAGIAVEIAHLKLHGHRNWEGADRLLALIDDAHSRGVRIGCDQYPYAASATWLGAVLPYWAQAGGAKTVAERLTDPATRARIRQEREKDRVAWDNRCGPPTWDGILVTDCSARPDVLGKNIAEIAEMDAKHPLEVIFDLIVVSKSQVGCVFFDQLEDNVRTLMRHPLVVVGSDGLALSPHGVLGQGNPHPRSYGTFPRVLGHYVREKVLTLEEAVKKMTSITAARFGLTDRGVIREGAWADLVLFDPQTIADKATFGDPHQYPDGIPYVIVNGVVVIDQHQHTGALPGKVL